MPDHAVSPFLFGKMPAHGDFVRRGLTPAAEAAWDGWLAREMVTARSAHGATFDDLYARAPVCRFLTRSDARAGALACSIDAVGRQFPLLIGVAVESPSPGLAAACEDKVYEAFAEGWNADQLLSGLAMIKSVDDETGPAEGWWISGVELEEQLSGERPEGLLTALLNVARAAS
jgi:type VI secretion system ImpM family protein